MKISDKQADFLCNSTASYNIAVGAVSSGKSYIMSLRFFSYIFNEAPENSLLLIVAKTLESAYDNVVRALKELDKDVDKLQFSYARPGIVTRIKYEEKNIEIAVVGAATENSWQRVQGRSTAGILVDEWTNIPKNLTKIICKGSRHGGMQHPKFFSTNPDIPSNYVRTEYLLNKNIDSKIWNFTMDDNPSLTDDYVRELKATYNGVMYDRFILGKWIASSDQTVYRFDRRVNEVRDTLPVEMGVETWSCWDFGISDPTFIIIMQIHQVPYSINKKGIVIRIVDEYINRNKDADHYKKWLLSRPYYKEVDWYHACDPSGVSRGASLKSWVSELAPEIQMTYKTKPSVNDMISISNKFIDCVQINERQCPRTFEMFENWAYPMDKNDQLKEGALPIHDLYSHSGSAFYYGMVNRFGNDSRGGALIL